MNIVFESQFPEGITRIKRLAEQEYRKTLTKAAKGGYGAIAKQFVLSDAVATGNTVASFEISDITSFGDRFEIEVAPNSDRQHIVDVIENGRDEYRRLPSKEAFDNISEWMRARNIGQGLPAKKKRRLTFAIMASIKEYGIEPRHLVEKATSQYRSSIIRLFESATRRIVRKVNRGYNVSRDND